MKYWFLQLIYLSLYIRITPLFNVLKCYSLLFPQIGYCQGMAFVCATLLMNIDNVEVA